VPSRKALRNSSLVLLIPLALAFLVTPALAATPYTVTVQTDAASYIAAQQIMISGTVTPAPGANTAVITIKAPDNKTVVDTGDDVVSATTGAYSHVTVAGGTAAWIAGTYTVNATWGGYSSTAVAVTRFHYSPTASTTTTTSTTSTTSTTTTTTTTSTSTTSRTSTTSSTTSSSTTTTSTTAPTTTSTVPTSSTVTQTVTVSSSSSSSTTTSVPGSSGGLGSYIIPIVVVVVVILAAVGVVMWRRKVAADYKRSFPR
jgi:hypothetical protein